MVVKHCFLGLQAVGLLFGIEHLLLAVQLLLELVVIGLVLLADIIFHFFIVQVV